MREKNERPDQKKTKKKKKNKQDGNQLPLPLLINFNTYKFNTIKNIGLFMYSTYRRFFLQ